MNTRTFGFGLSFTDLYDRDGLVRLDSAFADFVNERDAETAAALTAARRDPAALAPKDESDLLLTLAPHVEAFVVELFGIHEPHAALVAAQDALEPVYAAKRRFVQKRALKAFPAVAGPAQLGPLR